jgi:hypothetical protein
MDPDPRIRIPAIFVSDLQVTSFFAFYFMKVHLHHFSNIKSHTEVTEQWESMFFYYFCLMIEGSGSVSYLVLMDPDPGGPKTYGSCPTDPDPQHCVTEGFC